MQNSKVNLSLNLTKEIDAFAVKQYQLTRNSVLKWKVACDTFGNRNKNYAVTQIKYLFTKSAMLKFLKVIQDFSKCSVKPHFWRLSRLSIQNNQSVNNGYNIH